MAIEAYDLAGTTDLDVTVIQVTSRVGLCQRIMRRLTTRRGALLDEPSYGDDVRLFIGAAVTDSEVSQRVLAQVFAEEDVEDARLTIAFGERLELGIRITDSEGDFSLVLAANSPTGALELLLLEAA